MKNYSQNDPRWKNLRLGTSDTTFGKSGCFVTSLAMLADVEPTKANELFKTSGVYRNGCLIGDPQKAADVLRIGYEGKGDPTSPRGSTCIAETNHYAPITKQHFFVWIGDGNIIDPIDGKKKLNNYKIVSFRLFRPKINENPMALFSDKEIDDQFRLFLNGRATDNDKLFWRTRDINDLVAQLCNSKERFDLINRIFKAITGKDATDQDQATFNTQRWSIGEITKVALERGNK